MYAVLQFIAIVLLFSACSTPKEESPDGLIHIDVLEAFKEQKSMKLSEFVKEVEFIQFEASKDSYFLNPKSFTVGKKYIMISDGSNRVIIFDRNGKFIRHIGRKGKGPGEYNRPQHVAMDPDEEIIVIADGMAQKLIKYSISGDFIKEIRTKDLLQSRIMDDIHFINDNNFIVLMRRPIEEVDGYASMLMFNEDLEIVKKILPRAKDENLVLYTQPNGIIGVGDKDLTFWEPYLDTLYTISKDGDAVPSHVIGFSKGGPSREYAKTPMYRRGSDLEPEYSLYNLTKMGGFFHINGRSNNGWFTALYNIKSGDSFQLSSVGVCDTTGRFGMAGFENDLFGINPITLYGNSPIVDRLTSWTRPDWIATSYDLDCIKKKKVKFPKLRDQYLEIAEKAETSGQMMLILMKLK